MQKILEDIQTLIRKLGIYNTNMAGIEEYELYINSIQNLESQIAVLSSTDASGEAHVLTGEEVDYLRKCYLDVFAASSSFKKKLTSGSLHGNFVKEQLGLIGAFSDILAENYGELSGAIEKEGVTYEEMLDSAKGYELNIEGQNIGMEGGMLSNRVPINFTTKEGRHITGYFTEYTKRDFANERRRLIEKYSQGNPDMARILKNISTNRSLISAMNFDAKGFIYSFAHFYTTQEEINYQINRIVASSSSGAEYELVEKTNVETTDESDYSSPEEMANVQYMLESDRLRDEIGPDYNKNILNFIKEFIPVYSKEYLQMNAIRMDNHEKIEDRNAAMSAVADLLGRPDLLARTNKMTVIIDGKPHEGVFMETAPGEDIRKLFKNDNDESPLMDLNNPEDVNNPNFLKSVADLQIIDLICGNIDRHNANKLYQFSKQGDKMVLDGIKGIDNDSAFGVFGVDEHISYLPSISQMKYISQTMADQINHITPEVLKFTLQNFALTKKEIQAAVDRLNAVKKAIDDGTLTPVSDEEWQTINVNTLATGEDANGDESNYFDYALHLPASVNKNYRDQNLAPGNKQSYQNSCKNFPEFPAFESSSNQVTAAFLLENDSLVTKANHDKLILLEHEMDLNDIFYGSSAYTHVHEALTQVRKLTENINKNSSILDYRKLQKAYNNLEKNIENYLTKKNNEEIEKSKKGKSLSDVAVSRIKAVRQIKNFTKKRLFGIKNLYEKNIDAETLTSDVTALENEFKGSTFEPEKFALWEVKTNLLSSLNQNNNLKISEKSVLLSAENLMNNPAFKQVCSTYANQGDAVEPKDFHNTLMTEIANYGKTVSQDIADEPSNEMADDMNHQEINKSM